MNVARAVLENWRMPDEIVDAVGGYEDMDRELRGPVTLTDVLSLATQLERNRTPVLNTRGEQVQILAEIAIPPAPRPSVVR